MSQDGIPPPPAACLIRTRSSSQKGGTLIVEGVQDLATHQRNVALREPYRPLECPTCGGRTLHVQECRERVTRSDQIAVVEILIFQCQGCDGVWRILPLFLARLLWRRWPVVEAAVGLVQAPPSSPKVPESTVRRWVTRLASSALQLVQAMAATQQPTLVRLAGQLGLTATRRELVLVYAAALQLPPPCQLQELAAYLHRLVSGLRLA